MKKIEANQSKLQLKKEKIAPLVKGNGAGFSHVEPTTTVLLTFQRKCITAKAD